MCSRDDDPTQHDIPRDSEKLVRQARAEYNQMTPEQRKEVEDSWNKRSEWEKEQIRAEVEFDLL